MAESPFGFGRGAWRCLGAESSPASISNSDATGSAWFAKLRAAIGTYLLSNVDAPARPRPRAERPPWTRVHTQSEKIFLYAAWTGAS